VLSAAPRADFFPDRRRYRLVLLLIGFSVLPEAAAQQAPVPRRLPANIQLNQVPEQDPDALVTEGLKNYRGLRQIDPQQLQRQSISVGENQMMALSEVAEGILASHQKLESELSRAPRALLGGKTNSSIDLIETEETFILVRSTQAIVLDPVAAANASPEFKNYLQNSTAPQKQALADLSPESKKGIEKFIRDKLHTLSADDPLRKAYARGGEQGLLDAVVNGQGSLEIIDTFIIPKTQLPVVDGRLRIPTIRNGVFSFQHSVPSTLIALPERNMGGLTKIDRQQLSQGNQIVALERPGAAPETSAPAGARTASSTQAGEERFTAEFLTGFTEGNSWQWERRWSYPSGFFSHHPGCRLRDRTTGSDCGARPLRPHTA